MYRRKVGRCTATLIHIFGDIDLADDCGPQGLRDRVGAVAEQERTAEPGGWITIDARNRAIDQVRRESTRLSSNAPERDFLRQQRAVVDS
jgi:RNA polymerase sigma-70 factor (ECF subfamily)